jgi:hypothetical protein
MKDINTGIKYKIRDKEKSYLNTNKTETLLNVRSLLRFKDKK